MEKLNINHLIREAKEKLAGKDATRLAAFHAAVTAAAALMITLLQFVLSKGIGNTGGLSGMGTRSVLETVQTVLQWANMLLLPFWDLGFLYAALQWAKGNVPRREDLLTGFRRIGPYLGLMLNRGLITFIVVFLCINIGSTIYMMTPAAADMMELAESVGTDMAALEQYMEQVSQLDTRELIRSMGGLLAICGVLCGIILIPLMYLFRFAEFVILSQPGARGMSSMILSATLLRRRRWQLFKLDLKLWWYYGLKLLCEVLFYGDLVLEALGVTVPVNGDLMFLLTYVLYLVVQFAVQTLFAPRVETTYACAYEACLAMGPVQKKAMPVKPQNMPWDEE